jgi:hypothetical protein
VKQVLLLVRAVSRWLLVWLILVEGTQRPLIICRDLRISSGNENIYSPWCLKLGRDGTKFVPVFLKQV